MSWLPWKELWACHGIASQMHVALNLLQKLYGVTEYEDHHDQKSLWKTVFPIWGVESDSWRIQEQGMIHTRIWDMHVFRSRV